MAIYEKMFKLSYKELSKSAAVSLMSTDMSGIEMLVNLFYSIGASVVELSLGLYILATIVGPTCVLVFVPALCKLTHSPQQVT